MIDPPAFLIITGRPCLLASRVSQAFTSIARSHIVMATLAALLTICLRRRMPPMLSEP
jgi:hypothetical protein